MAIPTGGVKNIKVAWDGHRRSAYPLNPDDGVPSSDMHFAWSGAATSEGFSVVSEPQGEASLKFEVSSDAFSTIAYTEIQTTTPGSPARFTAAGLSAGTPYSWRVTSGGFSKTGSTKTFPSGASSVVIAVGSCARGTSAPGPTSDVSNAASFTRIKERAPNVFIHTGDLFYRDIATNDESIYGQAYRDVLDCVNQADLYANIPLAYVWDDHDYGVNDSGGNSVSKPAAQSAYRKYSPHYPLQGEGQIGQEFTLGRVRVFMMDVRSERDEFASPPTALGATQKAHLAAVMDDVVAKGQMLILDTSTPWIAASGNDAWSEFLVERVEIADMIDTRGLNARVMFVCGDSHALAIDNGTNNNYATSGNWSPTGPPFLMAAPLDNGLNLKGGPYTFTSEASQQQYGVIEINDTGGTSIPYTLRGISVDTTTGAETESISLQGTFTIPA